VYAWIREQRGGRVGERDAGNAARGRDERRRLTPHDQRCVRLALMVGADRYTGTRVHTRPRATRAGQASETSEGIWMEGAVHLERDERERSSAQRDVGRDVGLVRIGRAHDDEAALEIEQVARGQRVVGIDPQRGAAQRIVGETQERPRGEPREAPATDGDLDPEERRALELVQPLPGRLRCAIAHLVRCGDGDGGCRGGHRAGESLDELMAQLLQRGRAIDTRLGGREAG